MHDLGGPALFFVLAGLVGGLVMFGRGLIAYRRDRLISSVATSSLDAIAAGEVRVSGVVQAVDMTLISPLQSVPCVWYRSRVEETDDNGRVLLNEERAQQFRIVDGSGQIRVVPRGARWEIDPTFDERDSLTGNPPPGLNRRTGSTIAAVEPDPEHMSDIEREAAVQALLTVQKPVGGQLGDDWAADGGAWSGTLGLGGTRNKRYREARLEPGDTVTIIGQALPWGDICEAFYTFDPNTNVESAIAADISAARAHGVLAASPEEAWGNAAIPGFGIGRPTVTPELDPDATPMTGGGGETPHEVLAHQEIPDEELVLSRGDRTEMALYKGPPDEATMHHDYAFALGVLGAFMSVFCVLALGAMVTGTL